MPSSYAPDTDFEGEDSFADRAHDGTTPSPIATVKITVLPRASTRGRSSRSAPSRTAVAGAGCGIEGDVLAGADEVRGRSASGSSTAARTGGIGALHYRAPVRDARCRWGQALPRLAGFATPRSRCNYAGDGKRRIRGEQLVTQVAAR